MYGEIYYHTYCQAGSGFPARLSILKKDYTGAATFVEAGVDPFIKAAVDTDYDLIGGVYPTMAKIQLVGSGEFGMRDLVTYDESEFKVEHYINGVLDWVGFVTPEGFNSLDTNGARLLNINAIDGLTKLKKIKFAPTDTTNYGNSTGDYSMTLLFAVKECLLKTGLSLDILSLVDRSAVTVPTTPSQYTVIGNTSGWIYSTGFNSLDPALVATGNYIKFSVDGVAGDYIALITDVDRSAVGGGGGVGIKLNPVTLPADTSTISAVFFAPTPNTTQDALALISHDTRVWIDPSVAITYTSKAQSLKPYYEFTEGTKDAWFVLDEIAKFLDVRIQQQAGRWVVRPVDFNRVSFDFYHYSPDGVFIDKVPQASAEGIPACVDEDSYRLDGNTRYWGRTLKTALVAYKYRLKVKDDPLSNLISNGQFAFPTGTFPPDTFTPLGWTRSNGGIVFNVDRSINILEFSTPNPGFNDQSYIRSTGVDLKEGDEGVFKWWQSVQETNGYSGDGSFLVATIRLTANDGRIFYLVNSGEEDGWTDHKFLSPNPKGRWYEPEGTNPYQFITNYSTSHNPSPGGTFSAHSQVTVHFDSLPASGKVDIAFNGWGIIPSYIYADAARINAFIPDKNDTEDGIKYKENRYNFDPSNPSNRLQWAADTDFHLRIRVSNVSLEVVPSSNDRDGRLYEYTQESKYFDSLGPVELNIGDETNTDHMGRVSISGNYREAWTSLDGSLQVGPMGLVLARAIMRRYYRPMQRMDGTIGDREVTLQSVMNFEEEPEVDWGVLSGELLFVNGEVKGSFYEMSNEVLPPGGFDRGPNSYNKD